MNLDQALSKLASTYGLDVDDLHIAVKDNPVGGYSGDPHNTPWPMGSIWEVEGQILNALAQAVEPKVIVNLGVAHGCSLLHLAQTGAKVYAIDIDLSNVNQSLFDNYDVEFIEADAMEWLKDYSSRKKFDFVFEDLDHEIESVSAVWSEAMPKIKKGGFLVSHDSEHYVVGERVRMGIALAGVGDVTRLLVEPADCGLAVWRNE